MAVQLCNGQEAHNNNNACGTDCSLKFAYFKEKTIIYSEIPGYLVSKGSA